MEPYPIKKKPPLKVGMKVKYFPHGNESYIFGTIVSTDGRKNGQRVYDFEPIEGVGRWGYRDQFEIVHN